MQICQHVSMISHNITLQEVFEAYRVDTSLTGLENEAYLSEIPGND